MPLRLARMEGRPMPEIVGGVSTLGWVALKALLLFLTAVVAFRIAERRTIAEMNAYDFVAAVAAGAIVGRVPNSSTTSYLEGAVTLIAILAAHAILSRLRYAKPVASLVDHPPRLLVENGHVIDRQMRRSGLTTDDLFALLRANHVQTLSEVRYVIYETRGRISVIRADEPADNSKSDILRVVTEAAAT